MKKLRLVLAVCLPLFFISCVDNLDMTSAIDQELIYGRWETENLANKRYVFIINKEGTYSWEMYRNEDLSDTDSGTWRLSGNQFRINSDKDFPRTVKIQLTSTHLTMNNGEGSIVYVKKGE